MEQRVSLITLAARDIPALAEFYERLGWRRTQSPDGVIAFDLTGQTLGLYPVEKLADDIGIDPAGIGQGAITLAHNVRHKENVAEVLGQAEAAGGRLLKPAQDVFWGGHHGYFADPEGHIWEVAFNPFSPLREDGAFRWNGY
ncbi:VOC family protein [uncultured Roseobacter sp.]|uniref:VOC family protein n=1 Tax=uncultured Roseobacter sp. TaxID=114847 RepID=UPI00261DB1CE|nr:VOC family protein [uncultured Roseobacter sp.]